MVGLKVTAEVRETEDSGKVERAVKNLFPGASLSGGDVLEGELEREGLEVLKNMIEKMKIGRTFWVQIKRNLEGRKSRVLFHKQAAFSGRLGLVESGDESPLGAIVLHMEGLDDHFVKWLTGFGRSLEF